MGQIQYTKSLCNVDNIYELGVNLQKIIDLDKLVKKIDNLYYRSIVAFYKDKPVNSIVNDLNSIKEALNNYGKLFIQFGFFIYEDSHFIFDDPYVLEGIKYNSNFHQTQISTIISTSENLNDEYYDKYKYSEVRFGNDEYNHFVAGYGIYLDNDLNVEYGYITANYSASPINTTIVDRTYHDFKDARDGDRIKEHISSLINREDIWKTDDTPIVRKTDDVAIRGGLAQEEILKFLHNIKTELVYFINGNYFDIKQVDDILKELNEENMFIGDPIDGLSDRVLHGGGKLIFKITDDVGFYVYTKLEKELEHYHSILYVGKYPSDEEEILFDKEEYEKSDEDEYITIHEFKPKFTSISEVNQALKGKKINLDKTMNRVSMPDFYAGPAVEEVYDGIYIHTVYAREASVSGDIYEYEIDDDDFVTVGIHSGLGNYNLRLSPKYYTGDEAGDYGIDVSDEGTISLSENTGGMFGGIREIHDLSEPLTAFVIEILMNTLVFEDHLLDEGVMYCPDCGEDYHNGEKSCPDCGTNLVTGFEMDMLEYKGLL